MKLKFEKFNTILADYQQQLQDAGNKNTPTQKKLDVMQGKIANALSVLVESPNIGNPNIDSENKGKGYAYKDVTKQKYNQIVDVFKKGGSDKTAVHWNDVAQGAIGDCYFLSAIGAVAKANPAALEKLIKGPNAEGNYEVTLYIDGSLFSSRKPQTVTVTPELVVDKYGNPIYAKVGDSELWVTLLEKAYAELRKKEKAWNPIIQFKDDGYDSLNTGWGEEGIEVLTGKEADLLWIKRMSDEKIKETINSALKDKRPLTTGTIPAPAKGKKGNKKQMAAKNIKIVLGHQYFVLDFDDATIKLQNPWNDEIMNDDGRGDITISFDDYKKYFRVISVQQK